MEGLQKRGDLFTFVPDKYSKRLELGNKYFIPPLSEQQMELRKCWHGWAGGALKGTLQCPRLSKRVVILWLMFERSPILMKTFLNNNNNTFLSPKS